MGNYESEIYIRGEYWIIDGNVDFADGDVGEKNHEMIAAEHVFSRYLDSVESLAAEYKIEHDEFEFDGVNQEAVENCLSAIEEYLTTGLRDDGDEEAQPEIQPISEEAAHELMIKEIGCNVDAYYILRGSGDPRLYCMMYDGWIAVRNNNVELYGFSNDRKAEVAEGVSNIIYEDLGLTDDEYDGHHVELYIYDQKTKRGFSTNLFDIQHPGHALNVGIKMPADTKPPKDQYLTWNPKDTTENTPNWGKKPPMKKPDQWTQAYRNKGLGFQPPWKGTSESIGPFYKWMTKLTESMSEEMSFIRSFFNGFDITALLVFADWLEERDDPRASLVRSSAQNNLGPSLRSPESQEIINYFGITSLHWCKQENELRKYLCHWSSPEIAYDEKENKFYKWDEEERKYSETGLDQVNNATLQNFFWSIISHGILRK